MGRIISIDSDGNEHYPYADWNNDNLTIKKEIPTNDKKETNAQYIKKMSDRELAKWFGEKFDECPNVRHESKCDNQCVLCWFEWLKEERE